MAFDFERARSHMVESQLRSGGVTQLPILAGMRSIAREEFVAADRRELAYVDDVHWFGAKGASRFMAPPATLAKLLKLADITASDRVLDVGAATGYSTAVISGMAREVVGLEADAALAEEAAANLVRLGLGNATIAIGDEPMSREAAFDVIVVQGALDRVPETYLSWLNEGGRIVALIRTGVVCVAHVLVRTGGVVTSRAEFSVSLPPLHGAARVEEFVF